MAFHMLVYIERYQTMPNAHHPMAADGSEWRSDNVEAIIGVLYPGS